MDGPAWHGRDTAGAPALSPEPPTQAAYGLAQLPEEHPGGARGRALQVATRTTLLFLLLPVEGAPAAVGLGVVVVAAGVGLGAVVVAAGAGPGPGVVVVVVVVLVVLGVAAAGPGAPRGSGGSWSQELVVHAARPLSRHQHELQSSSQVEPDLQERSLTTETAEV
ncbi:MHC class II transactivator [Frankliniella fusca]|uniref:MHC class II transactivator n=1 Tax=Frankliniella fusca TaxID=407009 RepID=A0AAE1GZF5_9NEOP|nr:MHC class II transactivator [Frankliniella fusca]